MLDSDLGRLPGWNWPTKNPLRGAGVKGNWERGLTLLGPFLGGRTGQFDQFGHFEADFFLDNFKQGNVRGAKIGNIRHEWPAITSIAGV